jgi:hypothetical protein
MRRLLSGLTLLSLLTACGADALPAPEASAGSAGNGGAAGSSGGAAGSSGGLVATGGVAGSAAGTGGATVGTGGAGGGLGGSAGSAGSSSGGSSGSGPVLPEGNAGAPPEQWTEHWFEHDQNIKLIDYNEWVVLYFDDDVDQSQTAWLLPFLTEVWQYTLLHYGQFTDGERDGRLYGIFHQGKYSGGHPSTYFDASHDYRNVSDAGPGPWPDGSFDLASHEISHIVEGASRGVHGSPAFGLWGDSKWAEFYQYDLYLGLGMDADAERVFDKFSATSDSFPQAGSYWFRDWYYPLWRDHGGVDVMVGYFELLAEHFPKNGDSYAGDMNFGEYVHFMSGAVNANLKALATDAFGWPGERETEFQNARTEFSGITYPD